MFPFAKEYNHWRSYYLFLFFIFPILRPQSIHTPPWEQDSPTDLNIFVENANSAVVDPPPPLSTPHFPLVLNFNASEPF